uniref:Uncharacterized protein n=1 Tax=Anopheles dirus TaxID=7168 RepID=A0A182NY39_9DIPT
MHARRSVAKRIIGSLACPRLGDDTS